MVISHITIFYLLKRVAHVNRATRFFHPHFVWPMGWLKNTVSFVTPIHPLRPYGKKSDFSGPIIADVRH